MIIDTDLIISLGLKTQNIVLWKSIKDFNVGTDMPNRLNIEFNNV